MHKKSPKFPKEKNGQNLQKGNQRFRTILQSGFSLGG